MTEASAIILLAGVLFVALWLWTLFRVATSARAGGVEKALWVLIDLMFPVLGYLAFVLAKPGRARTPGDVAAGKR